MMSGEINDRQQRGPSPMIFGPVFATVDLFVRSCFPAQNTPGRGHGRLDLLFVSPFLAFARHGRLPIAASFDLIFYF